MLLALLGEQGKLRPDGGEVVDVVLGQPPLTP
jgi:hypothetical protein